MEKCPTIETRKKNPRIERSTHVHILSAKYFMEEKDKQTHESKCQTMKGEREVLNREHFKRKIYEIVCISLKCTWFPPKRGTPVSKSPYSIGCTYHVNT